MAGGSREQSGTHKGKLATSTNVKRNILIQDYPEGGMRAPDVELFARALQIRSIRHVLEPRPGTNRNFILNWLRSTYGHLKQGIRLLTSTCDFMKLTDEHGPSKKWRWGLKARGAMKGLAPSTNQKGKRPHVTYHSLQDQGQVGPHKRTVNIKPTWTLGQLLMEPLIYNPNIAGWWGAKLQTLPSMPTCPDGK